MEEDKVYCNCFAYMSNGAGMCLFCNREMQPIELKGDGLV